MKHLRFESDSLPISVNKLYFFRGGRRRLSAEGRKFKVAFVATRGGCSLQNLMKFTGTPDDKYCLRLWFRMSPERLYNSRYGKDKRIKSPYKDIDVSNMVKLIEDSISELIGIRDRNNWIVVCQKIESKTEGVTALLYPLEYEKELTRGVDETIRSVEASSGAGG